MRTNPDPTLLTVVSPASVVRLSLFSTKKLPLAAVTNGNSSVTRLALVASARDGAPGEEELPQPPSDEEVEKAAEALHAPIAERDTLPLEGE